MARIFKNEAVIFDLDDLLYKEFDFMRSGFWTIARTVETEEPKNLFRMMMARYFLGQSVLDWLCIEYLSNSEFTVESLLSIYRNHQPDISLAAETEQLLNALKQNGNKIGILTDGRASTQRNKIKALKLENWVDVISVSEECGYEKPAEEPYRFFMEQFKLDRFVYLADNFNKDFIAPNKLGWRTIALLDNGLNIHTRKKELNQLNYPGEVVNSLSEIEVNACFG